MATWLHYELLTVGKHIILVLFDLMSSTFEILKTNANQRREGF